MSNPVDKATDTFALESLAAYLEGVGHGADAALAKLRPIPGADSIARQLTILLEAERPDDALALIESEVPHERWIALAIQAAALAGSMKMANHLFSTVDTSGDITLRIRCAAAYAQGVVVKIFKNRNDPRFLLPGDVRAQEQTWLLDATSRFTALLGYVAARGKVENELESQGLQLLLTIHYLRGMREEAAEIVRLLLTRVPIPLRVAEAVMQGLISCTPEIPLRLRTEHKGALDANMMACVLEARYLDSKEEAFRHAVELSDKVKTEAEKESLIELMYELSTDISDVAFKEYTIKLAKRILGVDSRVMQLIDADIALRSGDPAGALERLSAIESREDTTWLGLYGNALMNAGRQQEALDIFNRLALLAPHPAVYWQISRIARNIGDSKKNEDALRKIIALNPESLAARRELAAEYAKSKRYKDAAAESYCIVNSGSAQVADYVNLAVSLSSNGEGSRAIEVLKDALSGRPEEVQILIPLADMLLSSGDASAAFFTLNAVRKKHWGIPQFLLAYMNSGYASGHEAEASEAFLRLRDLSEQGLVEPTLMRAIPIEEVVELVKNDRERMANWLRNELAGKMPWTLTANFGNDVPYMTWARKTQPMRWVYEEASRWPAFHLYATHGFRILQSPDSTELVPVRAPSAPTEVVADVSALITLHALELLDSTTEFFTKIVIPAEYLPRIANETRKLFPHQASQLKSARLIKDFIDRDRIKIVHPPLSEEYLLLDEYSDCAPGEVTRVGISDVLQVMHAHGYVSDVVKEAVEKVAHRPPGAAVLSPRKKITVSLSTLSTLATVEVLAPLSRCFQLYLTERDEQENYQKLEEFSFLETIRERHGDMWRKVRANPKISPEAAPQQENRAQAVADDDSTLAAVSLAISRKLPLMTDDRVYQSVVANERRTDPYASFGTSQLLTALVEARCITLDRAADCFLQLMTWRYRFIVAPSAILKTFALRFVSHPPGEELRAVSRYVHDCMRDPGLSAGFEPTAPPTPIAMRLYRGWVESITEFLLEVWMDRNFTEDNVGKITTWAVTELMPSPPKVLSIEMQASLGGMLERIVLTNAFIRASNATSADSKRINAGLTKISRLLHLDDRYLTILTEVVNARAV